MRVGAFAHVERIDVAEAEDAVGVAAHGLRRAAIGLDALLMAGRSWPARPERGEAELLHLEMVGDREHSFIELILRVEVDVRVNSHGCFALKSPYHVICYFLQRRLCERQRFGNFWRTFSRTFSPTFSPTFFGSANSINACA